MAQWVKATVAKPVDLSSIPRTRMVEGENHSSHKFFSVPLLYAEACASLIQIDGWINRLD